MREVAFIRQNKEKWLETEQVISGNLKKNPDDLSSLYISLVNDLSFSQTYYPKSKTTDYLNFLATGLFQRIYKTRRAEGSRLLYFFKTEVPLLLYRYRRYLYYSFALAALFTLIGAVSTFYEPDFPRKILGDSYVDETLENIKKGNAIAVYGQGSAWGSAVLIILNNLFVGARAYLYGIFGGVGTLFVLLQNFIMLGAFQYFFENQGVLSDSARGIWVHGAFEIFGIVVEGMAGLVLGAAVLFPGTFSRFDSFKQGFRDSFKIFLSTVPFTVCAGILEGFVTRHALKMPLLLNLLIIFGSLGAIGYYYLIYPFHVKKIKIMMQFYKLRTFGELVSDTFAFFKQYGKNYFKTYLTLNGPLLILLVAMYAVGYQSFFKQIFASNADGDSYYYQEYFQQNTPLLMILGFAFLLIFLAMSLVMYSFPVLYMKRVAQAGAGAVEVSTQQMFADIRANAGRFFIFLFCMILVSVPVLAVVFAASFLLIFLLLIGILLFFLLVPAIMNMVNFTLFDYFNTDRGFFGSLRYAFRAQFSYGRLNLPTPFWKYWGSVAVLYFLIQTVSSIFMIVPMIMVVVSGYTFSNASAMANANSGGFLAIYIICYAVSILISFILSNALFVNAGLMYYDSRTDLHRRENFSEIDSIGTRED